MNEKYEVYWSSLAQKDLDEITEFISLDSVNSALLLFDKIKSKCDSLQFSPYRCRIVPELKKIDIDSFRELILNPYRVIFKIVNDAVFIMAVLDGRRDLEDILLDRLI
ncbi:type II toxin-antitoxin system RelE/ParE family toxin [candidate division KSB1 bacterium]|nr:type II toxin-antitoxin system RelE/ParE family toxin [candidate division KSB1 bacterium]